MTSTPADPLSSNEPQHYFWGEGEVRQKLDLYFLKVHSVRHQEKTLHRWEVFTQRKKLCNIPSFPSQETIT